MEIKNVDIHSHYFKDLNVNISGNFTLCYHDSITIEQTTLTINREEKLEFSMLIQINKGETLYKFINVKSLNDKYSQIESMFLNTKPWNQKNEFLEETVRKLTIMMKNYLEQNKIIILSRKR